MWPKPGNFTIVIRSNGSSSACAATQQRPVRNFSKITAASAGVKGISENPIRPRSDPDRAAKGPTKGPRQESSADDPSSRGKKERKERRARLRKIGRCVQVRCETSSSWRTWHRRVIGECRHAKVEAARSRVEELALRQKVLRGRVLRLRLVLVAASRSGRSVRRRGPRVGRVLVVTGVAAVAAGQLQRLALYVVLDETVLVVDAVALDLGRQMIVLDHGKVRGRGVVVVERRRRHPRSLGRLVVRVRGASLVPTYLRPAQ